MANPKSVAYLDLLRASELGAGVPDTLENEGTAGLADLAGRFWVRLHSGTAPIGPLNPLPVTPVGIGVTILYDRQDLSAANVKGTPGEIFTIRFANLLGPDPVYFMFFDLAAAPVGGEVPLGIAYRVPLNHILFENYSNGRDFLANGISWGLSSTSATFTDSAVAQPIEVGYL